MGSVVGQLLPIAVGVALSPLPIIAVVLMLVTPRGRLNGLAFIVGWWVGLGVVGTIGLAVAGGTKASGALEPESSRRKLPWASLDPISFQRLPESLPEPMSVQRDRRSSRRLRPTLRRFRAHSIGN